MPHLDDLVIFPRPRTFGPTAQGAPADAEATTVVDPTLGPEAFVVVVDGGVTVRHADTAGLRYGLDVVAQLRAQCPDGVPGLVIEDAPDFPVRGFMLDCSRDRVPTRATLERIVGLMRTARLNHLELYIEHTYAYAQHEIVWAAASPFDADDLQWLDALCAENGIELVANQNCLGHMGRWLAHDAYRYRAESPDGFEFLPGVQSPPGTLAPNADNAQFALGLVRELLANFTARRVNIGCDEPFELGRGVSADAVAERGKPAVYTEYVRQVAEPLVADGFEVLVWADVLRHDPALVAQLPAGIVPVAWNYEAPGMDTDALPDPLVAMLDDLGIDLRSHESFATNVAPLVEAGVPFWVAPGTSSWCSLVGRLDNALANLLDAAAVGRRHDAGGFLITDWGDHGHLQPPSVSFGPLLFGGAVSWGLDANRDLDVASLLDTYAFDDPTGTLGAAVVAMGEVWGQTGQRPFNNSPLFTAVVRGAFGLASGAPDGERIEAVVATLDAAIDALARATPHCVDADTVLDELDVAARLARVGALRLLGRLGVEQAHAVDDVASLVERQRTAWLRRARPGGLDDAVARIIV